MPPEFKDQETIYKDMEAAMQAELPDVTFYGPGSFIKAILSTIAAGIRILHIVLQQLYFNIFPQTADRESQKNYYNEWGLTWDEPSTETARATVLGKYRSKSTIGTKKWYEDTTKANFPVVTDARLISGQRGPGTADLIVSRNALPLYNSDITDIQAFFELPANKVLGLDLLVKTVGEPSA